MVSWFVVCAGAAPLAARAPIDPGPLVVPRIPTSDPLLSLALSVKLRDEVAGRTAPIRSETGVDLSALVQALARVGATVSPTIRLPPDRLLALERRAAGHSGRAQPDLQGMWRVEGPDLVAAARALEGLEVVEYVHLHLVGAPPPGDLGTPTPDYTALQTYLDGDPGIGAREAWTFGTRGAGVRLSDCEYGWQVDHEDLMDRDLGTEPGQTVPPWVAFLQYDQHGTAALGEAVAVDNAYGTTGGAPDVSVATFPEWSVEEGERRVTSITHAVEGSVAGDVVMLEMQAALLDPYAYGPAELDPDVWTITRLATDAGVVVVGAAGNGAQDLDAPIYAPYRDRGDSGAILVGAGLGDVSHDAAEFSTYGARVNVQGWGDYHVFTLGYGTWSELDGDTRQAYIEQFSGTSSATPMAAVAAVLLQSHVLAGRGTPLTPGEVRDLMIATGVPQGAGPHVGPLPDVPALLRAVDADADGALSAGWGGDDCDDLDGTAFPGGVEVWYDGIDQDCSGGSDGDRDGDGHDAEQAGGPDCDDDDPTVSPEATEVWYDGVDQDCSGGSDADQDADGHDALEEGGDDCDDLDPAANPGATEVWYDGVDEDCSGGTDTDRDGDGHDAREEGGDDCDDLDPAVNPDAAEVDNGVDDDCDGAVDPVTVGQEPGPCGCASPGSSAGAPWLLAALAARLGRRRRQR